MKILFRLLFLLVLIALGFWAWTVFFPKPETVVRNRLNKLAHLVSFSAGEGNFARIARIERLGLLFADQVEVRIDVPGLEAHSFDRRKDLMQAALATKQVTSGIKAEFLDINVEVGPDKKSALADLTLNAKIGDDKDLVVQELKITLKNIQGAWLVTRVETVKTLRL